jgi:ABC-type multidrug transport system ATPase subunit
MSALSARGIRVSYDGRPAAALDSLDVAPGEVVALLGRNGSGKSTLLRAMALVEIPTAGEVVVAGTAEPPVRRVTLALPHPWLFAGTTLANLERPLAARGVDSSTRRDRARRALDDLGIGHLAGKDARRLSTGETARVSLARALCLETPVLLLDEPFAHLDPSAVGPARAAIERRAAAGAAVVIAAVGPDGLAGMAARVVEVRAP